ncbi:MAG: cobalt-precorrin-6A reductase [Pseudomonadota bacterium]
MTLLILGGTGEARAMAERLAGCDAVVSLAGATQTPVAQVLPFRTGGFGGSQGFVRYLEEAGITAVLDLTHPYAQRISARTAGICADLGLPHLQYLRPPWQPQTGDDWVTVDDLADVTAHVRPGQTVFVASGRKTLAQFAGLQGCRVIFRQVDPPDKPFPLPGGEYLIGRPPFSVEDEHSLFTRLHVDWLVCKNAGWGPSAAKLTAARALGIPVIMLNRPSPGNWHVTDDIAMAENWARAQCMSG